MVELKSWVTVSQSIKALLGWKFPVQDLIYVLEVVPVSLSHLVAHMGWAYAKVRKELTHTIQITLP